MAPLAPLVNALAGAEYLVLRDAQGVGFAPAPPPEHRPVLADWKEALVHALDEGERILAQELLRLERLAAFLLAREGVPALTWATFYYPERPEPERVLTPAENLLLHLCWRARNLPAPWRVHLAATDSTLTLDLQEPVQALLRVESPGRLELYGWPETKTHEYLWAATQGRVAPKRLVLGNPKECIAWSWKEVWEHFAQKQPL